MPFACANVHYNDQSIDTKRESRLCAPKDTTRATDVEPIRSAEDEQNLGSSSPLVDSEFGTSTNHRCANAI